jgi:diaminopimelate epimerase
MKNEVQFYKYQGTGNDFILINSFDANIVLEPNQIEKICHRRFGVGADGLMILRKSTEYDFVMDFYNSDGQAGSMCGNGGRCIVAFAYDLGLIKNKTIFYAPDGAHEANYFNPEKIMLKMTNVSAIEKHHLGLFINTGSPHLVVAKNDSDMLDVYNEGKAIRNNSTYKNEGTNVNFVFPGLKTPKIFTYERGVEDETYSCGTGTVATALSLNHLHDKKSPIEIEAKGGLLKVHFQKKNQGQYENIWLEGPAKKTFVGTYTFD